MLGDRTVAEVAGIVEECFGAWPIPQVHDEQVRLRAEEIARQQGLLAEIASTLQPDQPIPALPYGVFREYQRVGNRTRFEALQRWRTRQIEMAAIACWLGADEEIESDRSVLAYLEDLLWAECEATWWVMPAHERHGTPIDLRVALTARALATILSLLRGRIGAEVRERVIDAIRRRVLGPFLDAEHRHAWLYSTNNWNAVCIGNVCITAMLLEHEPARLGRTIAHGLDHLGHFVSGFAADGGCTEGPSYWRFGFGWFIRLAAALHDYTGGRIHLAADERIEPICRYPLSVALAPGCELTFADAHGGHQDPVTATLINRFFDIRELLGLCELADDGRPVLASLDALLLYDGWTAEPLADRDDHLMAELGVALVRSGGTAVGAKAGHNGEHHNHNDVGSFIVFRGGRNYLTDPGAPIYSARTFSTQRYESVFCNSLGHSVPVIDGRQQPTGRAVAGTIAVEGLGADGAKTLRLDLAGAYDVESLRRFDRVIELSPDGREVALTDTLAFSAAPASVEEAFITTHPAEVGADGSSVVIRPDGAEPATLAAVETAGRFAVAELTEESRAESRSGDLLRRITFVPDETAEEMCLRFVLRLA